MRVIGSDPITRIFQLIFSAVLKRKIYNYPRSVCNILVKGLNEDVCNTPSLKQAGPYSAEMHRAAHMASLIVHAGTLPTNMDFGPFVATAAAVRELLDITDC